MLYFKTIHSNIYTNQKSTKYKYTILVIGQSLIRKIHNFNLLKQIKVFSLETIVNYANYELRS